MIGLTFDAGALIALERRRQRIAQVYRVAREMHLPRRVRGSAAAILISIVSSAGSGPVRSSPVRSEPVRSGPVRTLRVCADPNNAPLSSQRAPALENEVAELLARELGARVEYTWWAQRRGFYRNTLSAHACDVVIGVPAGLDMVRTTAPYYRSSYAFVARKDRDLGRAGA